MLIMGGLSFPGSDDGRATGNRWEMTTMRGYRLVAMTQGLLCGLSRRPLVESQVSGPKTQVSGFKSRVSSVRPQVSGLRSQAPSLRPQVSCPKSHASSLRPQIAGLKSQVSIINLKFRSQVSGPKCQVSSLKSHVSSLRHHASGPKSQASSLACHVSSRMSRASSRISLICLLCSALILCPSLSVAEENVDQQAPQGTHRKFGPPMRSLC